MSQEKLTEDLNFLIEKYDLLNSKYREKSEECVELKKELSEARLSQETLRAFHAKEVEMNERLKNQLLVAEGSASHTEAMTTKFLNKVDECNKLSIRHEEAIERNQRQAEVIHDYHKKNGVLEDHNKKLEAEVEALRLESEDLKDKLGKMRGKRDNLQEALDEVTVDRDELQERLDDLDELEEDDERMTYTEEDYDVWDNKYKTEKRKRKEAEEALKNFREQVHAEVTLKNVQIRDLKEELNSERKRRKVTHTIVLDD